MLISCGNFQYEHNKLKEFLSTKIVSDLRLQKEEFF